MATTIRTQEAGVKDPRPVTMTVSIDPRLKALIGQTADSVNVSMGDWVCEVLARELNRPELATIPRERPGRRRKEIAIP